MSEQPRKSLILGLTGSLGSGKTLVATLMRQAGLPVVCADELAREAVLPGSPELDTIKRTFGPDVLLADGGLDRKKIADIVFQDSEKKKALEAIIHPSVRRRILRFIDAHHQHPIIVCDVPLLYEASFQQLCDRVLVVTVDETVRLERLRRDRGMTSAEIEARLAQQIPQAEKVRRAQHVIDNSSDRSSTCQQLQKVLHHLYTDLGQTPPTLDCRSL